MDFYNLLLARKLGGGGGGDQYAAFKSVVNRSITEVTADMFEGVTSIGERAFSSCTALASITISESVTSIGNSAFSSCTALASITISESVTSIGNYAFSSCTALASITIPESVTSIGESAFSSCRSLTSITVRATTPPTLGYNAFFGIGSQIFIYVPAESVETYKTATYWSNYASRIQAIPN